MIGFVVMKEISTYSLILPMMRLRLMEEIVISPTVIYAKVAEFEFKAVRRPSLFDHASASAAGGSFP
jgi:hypothetical protein